MNDKIYYKIIPSNGLQFQEGLNIDPIPFNPIGCCLKGGIHFTDRDNISRFFHYGSLIAEITIPDNAQVYQEKPIHHWKADRIIINNVIRIEEFKGWQDPEFCRIAVQNNGMAIQYVNNPSVELCVIAVKNNGYSLQFIDQDRLDDRKGEICRLAVEYVPWAIKYVKEQTDELCKLAVKKNGLAIKYVNNKTDELCQLAIKQTKLAKLYID